MSDAILTLRRTSDCRFLVSSSCISRIFLLRQSLVGDHQPIPANCLVTPRVQSSQVRQPSSSGITLADDRCHLQSLGMMSTLYVWAPNLGHPTRVPSATSTRLLPLPTRVHLIQPPAISSSPNVLAGGCCHTPRTELRNTSSAVSSSLSSRTDLLCTKFPSSHLSLPTAGTPSTRSFSSLSVR